jgi:hypothetical protein
MGEGPDRVSADGGGEPVGRAARDVTVLRDEIGDLVDELDRRRHEAMDIGLQIRRHPLIAVGAVTAVALLAGGLVAVAVRNRRRRDRASEKVRALRRAFGRMARHPEEFSREPGMTQRIVTAALTVAATTLVKRMVERSVPARG